MTDEIIFERNGPWGIITLNRPDALNALTWPMVEAFRKQLMAWEAENAVKAVLVQGAGDRSFCAGGDIRWLHEEAKKDPQQASEFFREEYRNNAAIYHFPKPYVALIDGIVMGGGVGVSVHGDFRVAGDKTMFAMPETGIGLFPDVGGGHFMPRLHDGLGLYYALTGARAGAADCMAAGIATHYVTSDRNSDLVAGLLAVEFSTHPHADIEAVLDDFAGDPGEAEINMRRPIVAAAFQGRESVGEIIDALRATGGDIADDVARTIMRMSPTSLKLTLEQMRRGHELDFDDVMRMEFRMVCRVMIGKDFFEGVRAQIIDKDRKPAWSPASLQEVGEADIEAYFASLGDRELTLP